MKNCLMLKAGKTRGIAAALLAAASMLGSACGTKVKAAIPYDLMFIDAMVAHHQAAIDMSLPADSSALRPELREFARRVVEDQSREVEMMQSWRSQWYAGKPKTPTIMGMPGMAQSMKGMEPGHMHGLKGAEYDGMYVEMMIPHHEGAVVMAKEALVKAEHSEVRELAQRIIAAQQSEIEMMNRWKSEWTNAR